MAQHDDRPEERVARKEREWAKSDARELSNAVTAMLQHGETRRYLYWLFEITRCIGQNPYRGNFGDTAFACGEQNVGQQIMAHLLESAPEGFVSLLKERADERTRRSQDLDRIRDGNQPSDIGAVGRDEAG